MHKIKLYGETKTNKISFGLYNPIKANTAYFVPSISGFYNGEYISDPYKVEILNNGSVALYGRETNVRQRIMDAINQKIAELGGEIVDGEYWRGTENPNEPDLIHDGTIRPSVNHMTGESEEGLSVWPGANYLGSHKYLYKVSGDVNGWGADGEPTLDVSTLKVTAPIKVWGVWAKDIYKMQKSGKNKFMKQYGWTTEQIEQFKSNFCKVYLSRSDFVCMPEA